MNLLNQEISLSFNSVVFFTIVTVIVVLLVLSTVMFLRMRKTQSINKPKYGFLGKSLYGVMLVVLLSGSLVIAVVSTTSDAGIFQINANKTLAADIIIAPLMKENGSTYVDFKVVPSVQGDIWADNGDLFTVYWSFTGQAGQNYTYLEQNVSSKNLSGLQKYFKDDNYKVTVVIVYEDNSYTFNKEVTF